MPASFRVIRHVRPKFSRRSCESIIQAPAPELPIPRGRATADLLTHVLVAKLADHLPQYRRSEIYARGGIELERSTLADWVGQSAALLRPLIDALARHVLAADRVHPDDTPVPVLAPGAGKTRIACWRGFALPNLTVQRALRSFWCSLAGFLRPTLRDLSGLDRGSLGFDVTLFRVGDDGRIDDLPAHRQIADRP